jgi:hypothetical protein
MHAYRSEHGGFFPFGGDITAEDRALLAAAVSAPTEAEIPKLNALGVRISAARSRGMLVGPVTESFIRDIISHGGADTSIFQPYTERDPGGPRPLPPIPLDDLNRALAYLSSQNNAPEPVIGPTEVVQVPGTPNEPGLQTADESHAGKRAEELTGLLIGEIMRQPSLGATYSNNARTDDLARVLESLGQNLDRSLDVKA